MKYVIIGNGIAGLSAAEEIRKGDKEASIKIISKEKYLTYYRVKLSHFINKLDYKLKDLMVHDESWYKEKNIELLLNTEVKSINTKTKELIIDDNNSIKYDKLLIANGSRPFVPPIDGINKEGVFALRTIDDLDEVQNYFKKCQTVSVIGGGLLGIEAAWAIRKMGKKVNIIEFFPYLLPRQLDEELGKYLEKNLEKEGLKFYLDAAAEKMEGNNKIESIMLKDGRKIDTDGVLVSTGIRSNIKIAEGSPIEIDRGIVVDKNMKTNVEDIYAAGDIAQFNGMVLALWSAAMDQGKIAGKNMLGESKEYTLPNSATTLMIGDIKMFSVGQIGDVEEELSIKGEDYFHKLFIKEGRLVGGVLFGDIKKMIALKNAVNEKRDISEMLNENLSGEEILNRL